MEDIKEPYNKNDVKSQLPKFLCATYSDFIDEIEEIEKSLNKVPDWSGFVKIPLITSELCRKYRLTKNEVFFILKMMESRGLIDLDRFRGVKVRK
jgi:hypothetical protein